MIKNRFFRSKNARANLNRIIFWKMEFYTAAQNKKIDSLWVWYPEACFGFLSCGEFIYLNASGLALGFFTIQTALVFIFLEFNAHITGCVKKLTSPPPSSSQGACTKTRRAPRAKPIGVGWAPIGKGNRQANICLLWSCNARGAASVPQKKYSYLQQSELFAN